MEIDLSSIDVARVAKWVIIILITGFITQFGRMLAQYIVRKTDERRARLKRKNSTEAATGSEPEVLNNKTAEAAEEAQKDKEQQKIEKKAAKARLKALKKSK